MEIRIANDQKSFFDIMSIRGRVFVDEQNVPCRIEIDDEDRTCRHVLLTDHGQAIACLRLLPRDTYYKVGRVAVLKPYRRQGYGRALMLAIEDMDFVKEKGELRLDAQKSAWDFYLKLGYELVGEPFVEANMLHRSAIKRLGISSKTSV